MSGDVTKGFLKRLSYIDGRPGEYDGGTLIAGQEYYDVYFTGGEILNVTFTGGNINGVPFNRTETIVTAAGKYQVLPTYYVVTTHKTVGQATTVILEPPTLTAGRSVIIKDGKGDAAANNITLLGNGYNIDGAATMPIALNYGAAEIIFNGTEWNVINRFENFIPYTNEQAQDAVGSILTDTASVNLTYDDFANTITADVIDNSSTQKVQVSKNSGAVVGTRKNLNFIEGSNVVLTIADDAGNDQVDITITSSGGGGGGVAGPVSSTDNAMTRWDGTGGNLIQNSVVIVDDTGNMSGVGTLATGVATITASSANALAVGQTGTTSPTFNVNNSTALTVTGVEITGSTTGVNNPVIGAISPNASTSLTVQAKGGSGSLNLRGGAGISLQPNAGGTTRYAFQDSLIGLAPTTSAATTTRFAFTGAANTLLTASSEFTQIYFNLGQTNQHSTGNITTQRDLRITPMTHSAVGASVITSAYGFYIDGPPSAVPANVIDGAFIFATFSTDI